MSNPFPSSTSKPGHGSIVLRLLPPSTPVLQTVSYQYPLKLIAPDPATVPSSSSPEHNLTVHTVFLLSYGGGLVAGDAIRLAVALDPSTRLALLTQGSTKIFKTPRPDLPAAQRLTVDLAPGAALCLLPDPVQPFADSAFEQAQVFRLRGLGASVCVCDWVCEGRPARGERWAFRRYASRNEFWLVGAEGKGGEEEDVVEGEGGDRLMLRDNLVLEDEGFGVASGIAGKVNGMGVFGTLMIHGPIFDALGQFFLEEFEQLPRIGARKWDDDDDEGDDRRAKSWREVRVEQEVAGALLWTAAAVRGFVTVKFGAREVEGARTWLRSMVRHEGSVENNFGERALLCLR